METAVTQDPEVFGLFHVRSASHRYTYRLRLRPDGTFSRRHRCKAAKYGQHCWHKDAVLAHLVHFTTGATK